MSVFWTIQAQRHLRQALAESLWRENEAESERRSHPSTLSASASDPTQPRIGVLELTMDRLNEILAVHFDGASVVVKDQVIGYRRKKDLFILMVEAFGDEREKSGPFVVKIGPESQLRRGDPRLELLPPAGPEARPGVPRPGRGRSPSTSTARTG